MVYNTQIYWDFRVCPLSGILKTREHNVSESGSTSCHSYHNTNRNNELDAELKVVSVPNLSTKQWKCMGGKGTDPRTLNLGTRLRVNFTPLPGNEIRHETGETPEQVQELSKE